MSIREKNGDIQRKTELLKNKLKFGKFSVDNALLLWYYSQAD